MPRRHASSGIARPIGEHQTEQRVFIDALRNFLGMGPLYATEKRTIVFETTYRDVGDLESGCRRARAML